MGQARALQLRREAQMVSPVMGAAMIGRMYFLRANCAQHGGSASGGGLISASLLSYRALGQATQRCGSGGEGVAWMISERGARGRRRLLLRSRYAHGSLARVRLTHGYSHRLPLLFHYFVDLHERERHCIKLRILSHPSCVKPWEVLILQKSIQRN